MCDLLAVLFFIVGICNSTHRWEAYTIAALFAIADKIAGLVEKGD